MCMLTDPTPSAAHSPRQWLGYAQAFRQRFTWPATHWATPLGFIVTGANVSDFDQAKPLLKRYLKPGAYAIMDKGYDSAAIRDFIRERGGIAVIPPESQSLNQNGLR
jgi:hypothetical protein